MRKITKEINVYRFDELTKDVQERVINNEIDEEREDYCEQLLYSDMIDVADKLVLKYFKIKDAILDVHYDLSYSQGSGAMIEFTINIDDLNNKYHVFNDVEMQIIQDKGLVNEINVHHDNNSYCHEYTFNIKYDDNFGYWDYDGIKDNYNISKQDFENIENKLINLLDTYNKHYTKSPFIQDIINMNKEFTKDGYALIEGIDKEYVSDICKNYEYYENGEVYYE